MQRIRLSNVLLPVALVVAGAAATLAGCSGGGSSTPSSSGTPSPCSAAGAVVMVYPAPGATAIPTLMPGIVFGAPGALGGTSQALLQPSGSTSSTGFLPVTAAPSPLPTPNAIPTFAGVVYQISGSNGSLLPSATTLNVYYNDYSTACTPTLLGSFTTQ